MIAAPTVPATAAKADQSTLTWPDNTAEGVSDAYVRLPAPANITGVLSLSVPVGHDTTGLPNGMQLLGRPLGEPALLRGGHAYEQTQPARRLAAVQRGRQAAWSPQPAKTLNKLPQPGPGDGPRRPGHRCALPEGMAAEEHRRSRERDVRAASVGQPSVVYVANRLAGGCRSWASSVSGGRGHDVATDGPTDSPAPVRVAARPSALTELGVERRRSAGSADHYACPGQHPQAHRTPRPGVSERAAGGEERRWRPAPPTWLGRMLGRTGKGAPPPGW
ncbi:amidase family protein [Streptomyces nojiriensis]|uniref:amidase family protein n=1 Tax=Streptomyces nojiriensis TaxID=66374 RepID=UPI0035DABA54